MAWCKRYAVTLAIAAAMLPPVAHAAEERQEAAMVDFGHITSRDAAAAAAARGELVRVLLFPAELGGEDAEENVTYIPRAAAEAQQLIIGTLTRFLREGLIDTFEVEPEYKGDSFVPSRIVMRATHSVEPGSFNPTIEVW